MSTHFNNYDKIKSLKLRNRDIKIIILLTVIISLITATFILRPFNKEVVNLDKFADYYSEEGTYEDGFLLLSSNYYSKKMIYNIKYKKIEILELEDKFQMPVKKIYTVISGDTLSGIAVKEGVALSVLRNNNPEVTSNLKVGQELIIPSINGIYYKVKRGDSLSKIAYKFRVELSDIKLYNELEKEELSIGQELFLKDPDTDILNSIISLFKMPIRYTGISSPFGNRFHPILKRYILHSGVDLRARYISVSASKSGVVTYAGYSEGYGKLVKIKHPDGYETRYAHLNKIYVKKGQKVRVGQKIAQSGMTGRVTGPHLHFEIRKNGKPLNPMKYIEK